MNTSSPTTSGQNSQKFKPFDEMNQEEQALHQALIAAGFMVSRPPRHPGPSPASPDTAPSSSNSEPGTAPPSLEREVKPTNEKATTT